MLSHTPVVSDLQYCGENEYSMVLYMWNMGRSLCLFIQLFSRVQVSFEISSTMKNLWSHICIGLFLHIYDSSHICRSLLRYRKTRGLVYTQVFFYMYTTLFTFAGLFWDIQHYEGRVVFPRGEEFQSLHSYVYVSFCIYTHACTSLLNLHVFFHTNSFCIDFSFISTF